ncbi:hypothetical protein SARC_02960 [Sphaeroforma arctica JP610]|uniref:F-box domain-containing protein n=1 Tax=Sphaeroforma arctica JP610 TaxID=667725 RepID=A0A0L0G7C0_9EUKA|nr:hypothetical protein SARC_02960 [Sphaeroforma arctica JP610]KNC84819.1 hypothetical protein SARC_02960 [Sphaeroforma arctica JP610]|eukprot:XP_014158721.1 hypothetical protein SARC_02960 [Sphaeroforma arctica JP610]
MGDNMDADAQTATDMNTNNHSDVYEKSDRRSEEHEAHRTRDAEQGYAQLPQEVLIAIFQYLDPVGLVRASHVCSTWRQHACSEEMWRRIAHARGYNLKQGCSGACPRSDVNTKPVSRRPFEGACECTSWRRVGITCTLGFLNSPIQVVIVATANDIHRAACAASVVENMATLNGFDKLPATTPEEFIERGRSEDKSPLLVVYVIYLSDGAASTTAFQKLINMVESELEGADGSPTLFQGQHYGVYIKHRESPSIEADVSRLKNALRLCGATCMSSHTDSDHDDLSERTDCRLVGTDFRSWNRKLWRLCEKKRGWPTRRKQLNMNKTIRSADELWSFRAQRLALINRFKTRAHRRNQKRKFLDVDVYSVSSTIIVMVLCYFVQTRYYANSV